MLLVALVPLLALAAIAPLIDVSYDTRDSQPEDTESNRGYALLDRHYPVNEILPDYVLIQADHDLRNPRDLALLERAASAVAQEDGVVLVRSITRPLGKPITDASVARQAGIVGVRLDRASDRIGEGEDGAQQLADGAGQLGDGAGQLSDGTGQLADGARACGRRRGPAGGGDLGPRARSTTPAGRRRRRRLRHGAAGDRDARARPRARHRGGPGPARGRRARARLRRAPHQEPDLQPRSRMPPGSRRDPTDLGMQRDIRRQTIWLIRSSSAIKASPSVRSSRNVSSAPIDL